MEAQKGLLLDGFSGPVLEEAHYKPAGCLGLSGADIVLWRHLTEKNEEMGHGLY